MPVDLDSQIDAALYEVARIRATQEQKQEEDRQKEEDRSAYIAELIDELTSGE